MLAAPKRTERRLAPLPAFPHEDGHYGAVRWPDLRKHSIPVLAILAS